MLAEPWATILGMEVMSPGCFQAFKNISLGYTFPSSILKAAKIDSIRIFASADNVKLFSALKGMDPQYNFTGGTGYSYTPVRTVSLGVDINF